MTEERRQVKGRRHGEHRSSEDGTRIYILPVWVRMWHWSNAILILTLIATGVSLHFADGSLPLVEFSLAVRIHNVAGLLLFWLYSFFVIAKAGTGNWLQFVPKPVSYTHLDVYKRQPMVLVSSANLPESWSLVQI